MSPGMRSNPETPRCRTACIHGLRFAPGNYDCDVFVPELPEVETLRRDLERSLVGARITTTTLGRLRSIRRYGDPMQFVEQTEHAEFVGFERLGKYLLARLSTNQTLVVHLRMSGQLRLAAFFDESLPLHTHVRFRLDDGRELRFVDPRTFGEMYVTSGDVPELSHLGQDALSVLTDSDQFQRVLTNRRMVLKGVLLDQRSLAGVGSIYADEGCFVAGIRPTRSVASLNDAERDRLRVALLAVLEEGIAARGSTLGDGQYVDLFGQPGSYGAAHRVHARGGRPCPRCRRPLVRTIVVQRSAVYCEHCQQ